MRDEYFQFLFPEVQIRQDIDSKSRYQNTAGGERRATSVGGSVTGFHAHVIIVDDPLNPNEAISEKDRDKANRFMTDTLPTRKVDKLVSLTVLIMQRLHENDPAGQMLKNEDLVVEHICLPGYESPNINPPELVEYYVDRQLDPIRLSHAAMKKLKAAMGSYNYAGQIGQEPSPADGEIWKRSWFKIMPRAKILEAYKCINHGHDWDLAYTEDTKNSASAYVHGCKADHFAAVLDCGFAYLEFPPLIQYMKSKSERAHYIEAKASGKSAKQTLVRQGIPAVEITVAGGSDKMARTRFATPFAEAGMVIVAQEVADLFLDDPQQGLLKFPKTGTDLNDAFVQFLNRVLGKRPTRIKKRRTV